MGGQVRTVKSVTVQDDGWVNVEFTQAGKKLLVPADTNIKDVRKKGMP
jgi:hypothetical protein